MENTKPSIDSKIRKIELPAIGSTELGYISIVENFKNIPFEIKRVYWTYYTPQNVKRGGHAHKSLNQLIVAVSGKIIFNFEELSGIKTQFTLDNPSEGLLIPNMIWREIQFSHNAILLCVSSEEFKESDYIRSYSDFKLIQK